MRDFGQLAFVVDLSGTRHKNAECGDLQPGGLWQHNGLEVVMSDSHIVPQQELSARVRAVQSQLTKRNLDGYVLSVPENIYYLKPRWM